MDIDEVKKWPLKKCMEHITFLNMYYERKYGKVEDMEEFESMDKFDGKSVPRGLKKHMKGIGRKSRTSGHTFQFR